MSEAKPSDKIRWTYVVEGDVQQVLNTGTLVVKCGDDPILRYLAPGTPGASIEVIQPADDPGKEEVGAVRRGDHNGINYVVALSDQGVWKALFCGLQGYRIGFDHHEVVGWEKLEPVDGTPAAVALSKVSHRFEESYSGMVCGRMVIGADGFGDQCGLPSDRHEVYP